VKWFFAILYISPDEITVYKNGAPEKCKNKHAKACFVLNDIAIMG